MIEWGYAVLATVGTCAAIWACATGQGDRRTRRAQAATAAREARLARQVRG
jgi:hypothetical protein